MTADPAHVLVVDDDPGIRELLTSALTFAGYQVQAVGTAVAALDALRDARPDLVVLDVVLPDADGLDVLRMVRATGDRTPVLFLSSRDEVADRVAGLAAGGDDYVTKPFDLAEIAARLAALLRRARHEDVDADVLVYRDLRVDTGRKQAHRAGRPLDLTTTEFQLLTTLAASPERVLSKAQLLERVWAYDFGGDGAVVEKLVSRLRRKVDPPDAVPLIRTVRGFGYCLRAGDLGER
ncbi:MAG: response regulator transcription factor [Actinobacteria bacterium]|nr:response regulator transcription factor [Actinomycetota bacterium]